MSEQHFGGAYGGSAPENYERYFVPVIGAPAAAGLMAAAALRAGERVLDVACGTGVVARLAAQAVGPGGAVAGLDVDPGMLAVARANVPPGCSIAWHEASAEAMPLPEDSFDAVLCQMGLQFVPDRSAALREMRRVLAPGGRLILSVPGPTPALFAVVEAALGRHIGAQAAAFVGQVFSLHDPARIRELLNGAGFLDASLQAADRTLRLPPPARFLWQYLRATPLADALAQADGERVGALEREVVEHWREFVRDGALVLQVRMVVASARK